MPRTRDWGQTTKWSSWYRLRLAAHMLAKQLCLLVVPIETKIGKRSSGLRKTRSRERYATPVTCESMP
eukprot:4879157-Prymnesium_polylepis.1